jgi:hypothetical protein
MSRLRFNKITTPSTPASGKGEHFYSNTLSPAQPAFINESGTVYRMGGVWSNASTAAVGGGFASETYMTGSSINVGTAGIWQAGWVYECNFDMTKTAAGTAAPVIKIYMGTLGSLSDTAVLTLTGQAQTAAADTGVVTVNASFRSVGSGTSAVLTAGFTIAHNLSTTGFTSGAQVSTNVAASSGFNSTTQTIIGVSFNGGASFSGTNTFVMARLLG